MLASRCASTCIFLRRHVLDDCTQGLVCFESLRVAQVMQRQDKEQTTTCSCKHIPTGRTQLLSSMLSSTSLTIVTHKDTWPFERTGHQHIAGMVEFYIPFPSPRLTQQHQLRSLRPASFPQASCPPLVTTKTTEGVGCVLTVFQQVHWKSRSIDRLQRWRCIHSSWQLRWKS